MDEKIKFGILALIVIIFQSILKLYGVILTGSLSFLSETVDTLTDIIFVSITLYSLKQSEKPPDYEHMYGHSKLDSIGAMVQGIILMILYVVLVFNAIEVSLRGDYVVSNPVAGLQILIISFLVNIIFSRYLIWQGRRRKSLSLEIQGLNLFQDSMRAVLVIISFIFILFQIVYLDIIFSIALSIWIIISAFKLTKEGVNELVDVNPINMIILEDLKKKIFDLDHVLGVEELRVRAVGRILFLDIQLSVEDHISVVHANHITQSIRSMSRQYFPLFEVENIIQMRPISSEESLGESIFNLIFSLKADYPEILKISNINVFSFKDNNFLSQTMIVDDKLSLEEAHKICTEYENELKEQAPKLSRIITHIEARSKEKVIKPDEILCTDLDSSELERLNNEIEKILRVNKFVKGYHGLECWNTVNSCILELHVFFDGAINILKIHEIISALEEEIKNKNLVEGLQNCV